MLKLIAVDMDETFLRRDKTYDVELFKKILSELKEKDIKFLVASGNSYHHLKNFFDEADKEYIYFAGDNGSFIVQNDKLEESIGMNRSLYMSLLEFLEDYDGVSVYVSVGDRSYILKDDPFYETAKMYNGVLVEVDSFSQIPETDTAYKVAMITEHSLEFNKKLAEEVNEKFKEVFCVTSGNIFIDILHKDSGKGFAIKYLQEKYSIKEDECMAFGDSMNDASMMPVVKYSMSMENADPHLTEVCDYVVGSNEEQAVLEVISRYLEKDSLAFVEEYRK